MNEITSLMRELNGDSKKRTLKLGSPTQYDKQARMNALKPTASGVISSPDPV